MRVREVNNQQLNNCNVGKDLKISMNANIMYALSTLWIDEQWDLLYSQSNGVTVFTPGTRHTPSVTPGGYSVQFRTAREAEGFIIMVQFRLNGPTYIPSTYEIQREIIFTNTIINKNSIVIFLSF